MPQLSQFLPQAGHLDDQLFDSGNLWVEPPQYEQVIYLQCIAYWVVEIFWWIQQMTLGIL